MRALERLASPWWHARAGYFRRPPTSPRARTTRTLDTTRQSVRLVCAVTAHSSPTTRTRPDFASRSLSLCYACAVSTPSHAGCWFATDNALGRLQGGASCSLRVCLRECVAPAQQHPQVLVAYGARKGHPEAHVPAWSFAESSVRKLRVHAIYSAPSESVVWLSASRVRDAVPWRGARSRLYCVASTCQ